MITINNLDVRFDVEGDGRDEFERLFREAMRRWEAEAAHRRDRERRVRRETTVGDRHVQGGDA